MSSLALLQSLKESILSQANVKAIYGEPISAHGKTVIPVAKIMYGYGAGAGTGGVGDSSARGEGGGGGGGVRAIPVGVIEVSDQQTRFVPISDRKRLAGALLAGIGLGMSARVAKTVLKFVRFAEQLLSDDFGNGDLTYRPLRQGLNGFCPIRTHRFFSDHSFRSATMGSTPAARRAGITDASSAAKSSISAASASMKGFHGLTPNS